MSSFWGIVLYIRNIILLTQMSRSLRWHLDVAPTRADRGRPAAAKTLKALRGGFPELGGGGGGVT